MATISKEVFAGLPKGFQESISERSEIKAAIFNANTFKRYAKGCFKNHKENPLQRWDEVGQNALIPHYKKLLVVEVLANKYNELWGEKYYKCKLECEKLLNI